MWLEMLYQQTFTGQYNGKINTISLMADAFTQNPLNSIQW